MCGRRGLNSDSALLIGTTFLVAIFSRCAVRFLFSQMIERDPTKVKSREIMV